MRILGKRIAILLLSSGSLLAAPAAELPPLPSELPAGLATDGRARRVSPAIPAQRQITIPQVSRLQPGTNLLAARSYQPATLSDGILRWDQSEKEYHAQSGELNAPFTFAVTNVSSTNVIINYVRPSCGCTVAKLPPTPWTLQPGEGGIIELAVDLTGKHGILSKYISVDTSHGQKFLMIKVHIPQQQQNAAQGGMDARERNMQLAKADRQVVFRGDCAKCHSAPVVGKVKGEEVYQAACAICHDAPHRATMVPDLRALKNATGADYWKMWIINGKPGTLMPAFARAHGGPLTDEQINNLAEFMFEKFPRAHPGAPATVSGGPAVNVPNPGPSRN
jgi:mono/diheme cytochrome c family protein